MDMLQEPGELGELGEEVSTKNLLCANAPTRNDVGVVFIDWLREGIRSHLLLVNDRKAKVHIVDGTLFLVTPGIFQRYAAEHPVLAATDPKTDPWRTLQRQFEKMGVHLKNPNGQNIWTCSVQGPRKVSSLNGYLLRGDHPLCRDLQNDNPFLKLQP